jgi:predicted O-methyltransferase YrrM
MSSIDPNIARVDSRTRRPELYTADYQTAAEHQVQDLLAALIRLTNPRHVLEVGLARGSTTRAIVNALTNHAHLPIGTYTGIDIDPAATAHVRSRTRQAKVDMMFIKGSFERWTADRAFDLIFIDADWKNRGNEYAHARTMTSPGGLIVMHDTGNASPGRDQALAAPAKVGDATIDIACPRGITISQVPW